MTKTFSFMCILKFSSFITTIKFGAICAEWFKIISQSILYFFISIYFESLAYIFVHLLTIGVAVRFDDTYPVFVSFLSSQLKFCLHEQYTPFITLNCVYLRNLFEYLTYVLSTYQQPAKSDKPASPMADSPSKSPPDNAPTSNMNSPLSPWNYNNKGSNPSTDAVHHYMTGSPVSPTKNNPNSVM